MSLLPLSPHVFSILSGIVSEYAGLHFDSSHMPLFADKVASRAAERGFESLLDYYYYLRYDPGGAEEMAALVEALVVGETYFFRELPPLETVVSEVVLPALAAGRRPRIWCAACATGEEPHTLAMLLAARGVLDDVDLLASDISEAALARARAGRYSVRALRTALPAMAEPWLEIGAQHIAVRSSLTAAIEWRRINITDAGAVAALGKFDAILCRNVLIYFSDQTIRRVVNLLAGALRVGGTLLVGVSESLLRFGTPLVCEEKNSVFLYKRVS